MSAVSDQVQVAGFVLLGIWTVFGLLGLIIVHRAWLIGRAAKREKRARLAGYDRRYAERHARQNGRPITTDVERRAA